MSALTAERAARRVPQSSGVPVRGLLPLIVFLTAWQVFGDPQSTTVPTPDTWLTALRTMYEDGALVPALASTLRTFAIATVIAIVGGVALGVAIGSSPRLARALGPLLEFLRALPPPTLVPVVVLLIAATLWAGVTVVVLAIIWPILLNTVTARRTVPLVRLEMARNIGLSRRARLAKVILPSLTPAILLGIRIAISIALVVTLVADILGSGDGAGRLIVERQQTFDAPSVYGLLAIIGAFGFVVNAGLAHCEGLIMRNRPGGGA
jgi:sulfonate transport system permease protein